MRGNLHQDPKVERFEPNEGVLYGAKVAEAHRHRMASEVLGD